MTVQEEVFGTSYESASRYVDILATRGIEWGLIGPREGDRLWDRHVLNSVALAELLPSGATVAALPRARAESGVPWSS